MRKISIIPNKIFHKIWDLANENTKSDFYALCTSANSKKKIDFSRYGIKDEDVFTILCTVYTASQKTFKEILTEAKVTKASFSHAFCIPIRTVEDWYAGINKTPAYIRLNALRYYQLLRIGDYIDTEFTYKYRNIRKNVEPKKKSGSAVGNIEDEWFLKNRVSPESISAIEESIKTREVLELTSYLDKAVKDRRKR